ncbi:MAG: hypothetical protein ABIJ09_17990 [Pseudomonadota bacterium]
MAADTLARLLRLRSRQEDSARSMLRACHEAQDRLQQHLEALRSQAGSDPVHSVGEGLTQELCTLRCQIEQRALQQQLLAADQKEARARSEVLQRRADRVLVERVHERHLRQRQHRAELGLQRAADERSSRRRRPF